MKKLMAVILSLAFLMALGVVCAEAAYKSDLIDVDTNTLIEGKAVIDSDGFFGVKVVGVPDGTYLVELRHGMAFAPVLGEMVVVGGKGELEGFVPSGFYEDMRFWIILIGGGPGGSDLLKYASGIVIP